MRSLILAAILGLLVPMSPLWADLIFSEPLVKLGILKAGTHLQQRFPFEVRGSTTITLVGFERSCGCLAPQWEKTVFQPGEKGLLLVDIRSLGQPDGPHA